MDWTQTNGEIGEEKKQTGAIIKNVLTGKWFCSNETITKQTIKVLTER